MTFDEIAVLKENQTFLFENMRKVKSIEVVAKEESKDKSAEMIAGSAVPGNPSCMFTCSSAAAGQEEDKQPAGGKKGGKGKGGKQAEAPKEQKPAKGAGKPQKGGASGEVDSIESQLATSLWLGGHQPSSADREAFEGVGSAPNPETHPASFSWWLLVSKFAPAVRDAWAAGGDAGKGKADGGKAKEGKGKGGKKEKAAPKEEEDEMDLFGDDDEEDAAAKAELAAKAKDAGKKKKAPPVAKSLIIWDIKPWGPETDLDMLGKKIIAEIKMDGLTWKTEFKKEPVAFGVFKIVIGAVVEDAIVSTDLVQEKMEEMEDYV
jgi:elongation factor 1-beta